MSSDDSTPDVGDRLAALEALGLVMRPDVPQTLYWMPADSVLLLDGRKLSVIVYGTRPGRGCLIPDLRFGHIDQQHGRLLSKR